MTLVELLDLIKKLAKDHNLSEPWLCGGLPRDKYLGRVGEVVDIDITTGDSSIFALGKLLHQNVPDSSYHQEKDGHSEVTIGDLKIDFSSNFKMNGIREMLIQAGLTNPSELQMELFSRDFTCNALLMDLDLQNILDPTGLGVSDLDNKRLRTCLPAALTLGSDPKRIPRIVYLCAKLDFNPDPEIVSWVAQHPEEILKCKPKYIARKLYKALEFNREKTIELLDQLQLWPFLPALPALIPYMSGRI